MSWLATYPYAWRESNPYAFLAHFDSDFSDSGRNNASPTVSDVSIDTTNKKWGAGSLQFDGVDGNKVSYGYTSDWALGTDDFTIEAWVLINISPNAFGDSVGIVQSWNTSGWVFWLNESSSGVMHIKFSAYTAAGSTIVNIEGSTNLNDNTWHHVAISRTGSTFRLFVDGSQEATANSALAIGDPAQPLEMGPNFSTTGAYRPVYNIDELAIWNGTSQYQTSSFTPPTGPYS